MIGRYFCLLWMSALFCTSAAAGEPITIRGIHGAMTLRELMTALDRIDGIVYTLETNERYSCENAPTVSVYDESLVQSIPNFYPKEILLKGSKLEGKNFVGCFIRNISGASYQHSTAIFNMDSNTSGKLFSAEYKCAFFNGCHRNIHGLVKDFKNSQLFDIPLKEYPNSPDGTLFQGVTADGEGVGIRQNGNILVITADSKFFPNEDPHNKPNFQ